MSNDFKGEINQISESGIDRDMLSVSTNSGMIDEEHYSGGSHHRHAHPLRIEAEVMSFSALKIMLASSEKIRSRRTLL